MRSSAHSGQRSLQSLQPIAIKHGRLGLYYFMVLSLGVLCLWLGDRPLNNPDEGRYVQVALDMWRYGDWITPLLNGMKFFDKPILFYWLEALSLGVLGVNEWAMRFVPTLAAWLSGVGLYIVVRELYDERAAWLSGFCLLLNPLYYAGARYVNVDMLVCCWLTLCLLPLWWYLNQPNIHKTCWPLTLAYVMAALAVLTKGLIGIVFPGAILVLWALWQRDWRVLAKCWQWRGVMLFVVLVVPWFVMVQLKNPEHFHYFVVYQHFTRFLDTGFNNPMPIWFYLPVFFIGFFPWSAWILQACRYSTTQSSAKLTVYNDSRFLLVWCGFIILFFSLPQSKILSYILPAFPPAAALVGCYLSEQWFARFQGGIFHGFVAVWGVALLLAATAFFLPYFWGKCPEIPNSYYMALMVWSLSPAWVLHASNKQGTRALYTGVALFSLVFLLWLVGLSPKVVRNTTKPVAEVLNPILTDTDEVISYYEYFYDFPVYTNKRLSILDFWHEPASSDNYTRQFQWSSQYQDTSRWLVDDVEFLKRWKSKQRKFLLCVNADIENLQRRYRLQRLEFYQVMQTDYVTVFSNQPMAM